MNKFFENFEKLADNFERDAAQIYKTMQPTIELKTLREIQKIINKHGKFN